MPHANDLPRLSPTMASRRLLALDFVRDYLQRWHGSPSIREIAAAIGVNRSDANRIVKSLVAEGRLVRHRRERGLMMPDQIAGAIDMVRKAGYQVDQPGSPPALTLSTLSDLRELDHPPPAGGRADDRASAGNIGIDARGDRAGKRAGRRRA